MTDRTCVVPSCGKPHKAHGLCRSHYQRLRKYGDPLVGAGRTSREGTCAVLDCTEQIKARRLCVRHYHASRPRSNYPCKRTSSRARGQSGGGIDNRGYRRLYRPDHPDSYASGYILEHVLVMTEILGRPLMAGENVHHRNGDRADNRPENLELWTSSQPSGQRASDRIRDALRILELYGDDPTRF